MKLARNSIFLMLLLVVPTLHAQVLPDFASVVEDASPVVVNIATLNNVPQRASAPPPAEGDDERRPFDELFRRFFGDDEGRPPAPGQFDTTSMGSGFLISSDGFVVTNYHVVRSAREIIVTLSDRRQFVARVVGHDEDSDLAVLKLESTNLPVARSGSSEDLRVGEWVLAIGSPFGFEHSVTAGIVSAKGRALRSERFVPFIQTDVAINPGNSGGPLFNLQGEVVGINSQIYSRSGGFQGVSFAIPIEVALDVVEQLRASGRVSRGWLGVNIQDVSRELAESFGMGRPEGALVAGVRPDSPAGRAGIQVGDVIVEFDGKPVVRSSTLPQLVGGLRANATVPVRVLRDGRRRSLQVTLAELPRTARLAEAPVMPRSERGRLGLLVRDLTEQQRQALELADNGVMVSEVHDGAANRGGIRAGDIVLKINRTWVRDKAHFDALVDALDQTRPIAVLVQRSGTPVFLAVRVGDTE